MTNQKDKEIIASLNQWGVFFLSTPIACDTNRPLDAKELIAKLIQSDYSRFKLGVIAFFLIHPEKAPVVIESLTLLNPKSSLLLKYYYTAAVYLQRYWRSQWATHNTILLSDYFSKALGLPSPTTLHGRLGLFALEEALQQIIHEPYNYMASFDSLARLLQEQGT